MSTDDHKIDAELGVPFRPHTSFSKADIEERQALVQNSCQVIWGAED